MQGMIHRMKVLMNLIVQILFAQESNLFLCEGSASIDGNSGIDDATELETAVEVKAGISTSVGVTLGMFKGSDGIGVVVTFCLLGFLIPFLIVLYYLVFHCETIEHYIPQCLMILLKDLVSRTSILLKYGSLVLSLLFKEEVLLMLLFII